MIHFLSQVRASRRNLNSTRMVALSFGILILSGALLLMLPIMSKDGQSAGFMTALFTATSATCVTGLSLVDTLTQWTIGGQIIILLMIQLGGLGFMTAYTVILLLFQRRIGLSHRMIMASTLNMSRMDGVVRVVKHALFGTLLIEGSCAVLLATRFIPEFGFWGGLWRSIFHAVSAFCNAGFDLMGVQNGMASLTRFQNDPFILGIHMVLIVSGGLGFFVWEDLFRNRHPKHWSTYTKLVIGMTGLLIVFGCLYFFLAEYNNPQTLGALPLGSKLLNALFQSVTLRTAGFFTIPQEGLWQSSMVMSILFMLVGGSSGSTAGGLKTVTVGILLLALRAGLHGREEVTIRGRTVPRHRVMNAMTLTLTMILLFFVCSMAISLIEGSAYLPAAFEVASAMGTVGLTAGYTGTMSTVSQLLIVALMYLGRVGILSFSIAFLTRRRPEGKIKFPTLDVMIG